MINNATVLINTCLEQYTKVTINIINKLKDETEINKYCESIDKMMQKFGLNSVDRAYFYKLQTDSFLIYQYIACKYPFVRFMLPIEAYKGGKE